MNGVAGAHRTLRRGSKSFALAGRLLPADVADDAAVVYAYCRRADDLVDEAPGAADAVAHLRAELDRVMRGDRQDDAMLAAFQEVVLRRGIARDPIDDLLDGFAQDAQPPPIVYESWDQLLLYCYRVAGAVGLMMGPVLGVRDPAAARPAAALGMAMQLTNIARDVSEDWARGRLYVPHELLASLGATRPLVPRGPIDDASARLLAAASPHLLAAARSLYEDGDRGLSAMPARAAIGVRAARLIYSEIGAVIARQGHDVRAGRAVVGRGRKWWLALRALVDVARLPRARAVHAQQPGGVT